MARTSEELNISEVIWVQEGASGDLVLTERTAPSTIATAGQLYVKSSDHILYFKNSSGVETAVIGGGATSLTVGTTTIASGTTTRILYDNAGVLGEYTLTGTGTVVVMATSPTLVTPVIGAATGTSLVTTGLIESKTSFVLEDPGAGTHIITLQAPTLAADYTLTLPVDDGTSGQLLSTNGSGVLSWVDASGGSGITIGTTTITSGTSTRILYDNAGVVGEYTLTGTGTVVVMATSPTLVTPVLGVATATTITATVSSGGGTPGTFIMDSAADSTSAIVVKNNTNFASSVAIANIKTVNAGDTAPVLLLQNAGSGNYISADSAFTVAKSGNVAAGTYNKVTITAPATGSTLTIANGKTLTVSNTLTFTGTDGSSVAFGAGGTVLYGNQSISLTGDITGSGTTSIATTLATVNSNVGTFGSATQASVVTVNAKGLVTAASNTTVTPAVGSITGLGTGVATFLATPSSANLASALTDETGTGKAVFASKPTFIGTIQTVTAMAAQALDGSTGNVFTRTLAGSETFTQSNFSTGQFFIVEVTQGSGTTYTVTWFSGVTWVTSGAAAPTQTVTSNGITTYGFRCTGSNTFLGYLVGTQ